MSKRSRNKQDREAAASGASEKRPAPAFKPPLHPSRRLLIIAASLLAVWFGVLITLYITAIRPEKQRTGTTTHAPVTQPGTVAR